MLEFGQENLAELAVLQNETFLGTIAFHRKFGMLRLPKFHSIIEPP